MERGDSWKVELWEEWKIRRQDYGKGDNQKVGLWEGRIIRRLNCGKRG